MPQRLHFSLKNAINSRGNYWLNQYSQGLLNRVQMTDLWLFFSKLATQWSFALNRDRKWQMCHTLHLEREMLWKHAYPLLFWQFFLVHDKPKIKCFEFFSLVKNCPLRLSSNRRFSTPRDSHVILFNQSQKVNRPSETKRRFACDSAVAVVKVVFAVKFNKVMGNF